MEKIKVIQKPIRFEIYKELLNVYENGIYDRDFDKYDRCSNPINGMCYNASYLLEKKGLLPGRISVYRYLSELFPELKKYNKGTGGDWFDNNDERITVLKTILK